MTIDSIVEARRVISNEILSTQAIIASYVEVKLAELEETIAEVLTELADSDAVVA